MSEQPESTANELLTAMSHDLQQLVREEMQRVRDELGTAIKQGRRSGMLLGAAGVLAALAAGTSASALQRTWEAALPRPAAALTSTAELGAAAGACGWLGWRDLQRVRGELSSR